MQTPAPAVQASIEVVHGEAGTLRGVAGLRQHAQAELDKIAWCKADEAYTPHYGDNDSEDEELYDEETGATRII